MKILINLRNWDGIQYSRIRCKKILDVLKFSYSLQHKEKLPKMSRRVHKTFRLLKAHMLLMNTRKSQKEGNKASSQEETGTVMMAHASEIWFSLLISLNVLFHSEFSSTGFALPGEGSFFKNTYAIKCIWSGKYIYIFIYILFWGTFHRITE